MVVSPVVAGIALLLPVVEQWEGYGYIPAIVWLALFVQCLFTFRWRGLWFLLGPPVAFVAIEAFLVAAPPAPRLGTLIDRHDLRRPVDRISTHEIVDVLLQ
jgi:hypothetical protein